MCKPSTIDEECALSKPAASSMAVGDIDVAIKEFEALYNDAACTI
jgi:hypothetical protein